MRPVVSIITPWLDHPEFVEDFERTVRHPGVEVIVIDNGSSATNARLIRQMVQVTAREVALESRSQSISGAS